MQWGDAGFIHNTSTTNWTPSSWTFHKGYEYGYGPISLTHASGGAPVHYNFGRDGHGSVRILMDDITGGIYSGYDYDYDAGGNLLTAPAETFHIFIRYAGEYWDWDLRAYHNRARTFDPRTGTFWSSDSFLGSPDDPLSLHKYLYCAADPVNRIDPSGHDSVPGQAVTMGGISSLASWTGTAISAARARAMWNLARIALNQDKIFFYLEATAAGAAGLGLVGGVVDQMAGKLLGNTEAISQIDTERGRQIERIAGANLGGNVEAIDDLRPGGVATQVKSVGLQSGMDLDRRILNKVHEYAREMEGIEERELRGTSSDGRRVIIRPGTIQHKVLTVAIPENHAMVVQNRTLRQALETYRSAYKVYIQIVPVRGWRK